MTYKVLRHKKIKDLFGVFNSPSNQKSDTEIWTSETPQLLQMTASIDNLILYYEGSESIINQLKEYDLIEVCIVENNVVDKLMVLLDKKDILTLVRGSQPNYTEYENPILSEIGQHFEGLGDSWVWHHPRLNRLSFEELVKVYYICKDSWN